MPLFCVKCDQIDEWVKDFKEMSNPEDLDLVDNPRFVLSCRQGDSRAYVCYNGYREIIDSTDEVYSVVEENC